MLNISILVVDDVPANLVIVKEILKTQGYEVLTASSGKEALDLLKNREVQLVLLDVMMPEMNGFETSREMKALPGKESLPIIFVTALSDKEEVIQGFEAGGVDYVLKPFNKNELLIRVKTHLNLEVARKDLLEKNLALERTAGELRDSNQARDKFVSILAHDLKNPFSGLLGLIDEILKNLSTFSQEELKEIFQVLYNSSNNVYNLLLTLLEWGRAQTGSLVLSFQELHLPLLIEEIRQSFEVNIESKKLRFSVSMKADTAWGDLQTLSSAFRNLVSNSVKFTKSGGEILVSSFQEGKNVVLEFKDTGVGIKPEILSQLFRLDTKVSTPGTGKENGTGLGLLLCKEFVEINKGTLSVVTEEGKGSLFRVTLPLAGDPE